MSRRPDNDETYSEAEIVARREAALKRMLSTPPKPQSEMKVPGRKRGRPPKGAGSEPETVPGEPDPAEEGVIPLGGRAS